jgi:hypothetical protein
MPELGERATDLPLAPLPKHEMEHGGVLVAVVSSSAHACGSRHSVREPHPLLEPACGVVRDVASHGDPILPLVTKRWVEQRVTELSIVGEKHEPLGPEVEAPDRKKAFAQRRR